MEPPTYEQAIEQLQVSCSTVNTSSDSQKIGGSSGILLLNSKVLSQRDLNSESNIHIDIEKNEEYNSIPSLSLCGSSNDESSSNINYFPAQAQQEAKTEITSNEETDSSRRVSIGHERSNHDIHCNNEQRSNYTCCLCIIIIIIAITIACFIKFALFP